MPNVSRAVSFCQQQLDTLQQPFPEDVVNQMINGTVAYLAMPPNNIHLNEEEIARFRREIEFNNNIHQDDGAALRDNYDEPDWFTSYINIEDHPEYTQEQFVRTRATRTFFWSRYRRYLAESGFSLATLNHLDTATLNPMVNLLGNPNSERNFFRKGLVIGDVQSGKTATYTGLIAKAADAGYKIVILLTGTIEDLRRQTQKRLEEGFTGFDMAAQQKGRQVSVGVGRYNDNGTPHPGVVALTSQDGDFKANQIAMQLNDQSVFFLAIKKNKSTLEKLINWLIEVNADRQTGRIESSLLLVDDEADNASVNTRREDENPTVINGLIRQLAQIFTKTTYVGFTATPFANVFIAPDREDMALQDLFPSDFIYALEAPDTYIGARRIFATTEENGDVHIPEYHSSLNTIEDAGDREDDGYSFYHKHDPDWDDDLPESLTDAICCFFLFNALRDMKGDRAKPRTMMINISRFIDVQKRIKSKVETIIQNIFNSIQYHLDMEDPDNLGDNPWLNRLHDAWEKQYHTDNRMVEHDGQVVTWRMVAPLLQSANESLQLRAIYSGNKQERIDYDQYYRDNHFGMRVIAIGGLTLSRGLTLEGLGVTYFYRNTCTYDVLMQMGRWFGYRRNYEDLFRIWMGAQTMQWYGEIAQATEDLKSDIRMMQLQQLRPIDFGLRVKKISEDLSITAAIKMRSAQWITEYISFTGTLLETPYVSNGNTDNADNLTTISETWFQNYNIEISENKKVIRGVDRRTVSDFLRRIKLSPYNTKFPVNNILTFISDKDVLDTWDICFQEGNGSVFSPDGCNTGFNLVSRTIYTSLEEKKRIAIGQRGKVGGTADGKVCIDDDENKTKITHAQNLAKEAFERENPGKEWKDNYPSNTWFKFIQNRRPLLLIYFIEPKAPADSNEYIDRVIQNFEDTRQPLVCFALGIPTDGRDIPQKIRYAANRIYSAKELTQMADDNDNQEN